MNLYPALALIRHRLNSRGTAGHGVHSPFIYDFLTTVIRNKTPEHIVKHVEGLRREMKADNRIISVIDMGAGSLKRSGEKRRVRDIAGVASLPPKQAEVIARIAQSIIQPVWSRETGDTASGDSEKEGIVLELGTSLGISTLAIARAVPLRRVVTVEGCPSLAVIARENLLRHGAKNAEVMNLEFSKALGKLQEGGEKIMFAYIDGNHRGEALIDYVTTISGMGEKMIIIADDIHLNSDMYHAWKEIVRGGLGGASLETARFGILFRKSGMTPGRYRIWC